MKNILFLLILATGFFANAAVQTQLANKVIIGSSVASTDKTLEFNNNLGASNPKIKLNSTASKIQYSNDGTTYRDLGASDSYYGVNLLLNGGFENGIADGWTSTMFFQEAQASSVIYQKKSAVIQSPSSGYLETSAVALPKYLYGARCLARVSYMTSGVVNGLQMTVLNSADSSVTGGISVDFPGVASVSKKDSLLYFTCPTSGSIKLRITATLAIGYDVILDEAFLGALTISDYKLPTVQRFTNPGAGSYVTPFGVRYIKVRMVGGGGGGAGSGTGGGGGAGGAGGNTTFGTSLLTANGGTGGTGAGGPTAGGTVTVNAPAVNIHSVVGSNGGGIQITVTNAYLSSTQAGVSFFGGAGAGQGGGAGSSAAVNSGSGGAGGGSAATSVYTGASGAAGGYIEAIITNPSASYGFNVGAAGTAGTAGTSGFAGGAGGSGIIIVEEYY